MSEGTRFLPQGTRTRKNIRARDLADSLMSNSISDAKIHAIQNFTPGVYHCKFSPYIDSHYIFKKKMVLVHQ